MQKQKKNASKGVEPRFGDALVRMFQINSSERVEKPITRAANNLKAETFDDTDSVTKNSEMQRITTN